MSFLNSESFTLVENLNLTNAQKQDITAQETYQLIKTCLKSTESRIPSGYALKYRKQKESESIEQYAFELENLALEAYPNDQNIRQNHNLIECFISGIRNDELAIKLLEQNFENLTEAIQAAARYFLALQTRRFIKTESDFKQTMEKVYNLTSQNPEEENIVKTGDSKNPFTVNSATGNSLNTTNSSEQNSAQP